MRRSDPADWMWAEACDLVDQAERLHRRFFHLNARSRVAWAPPVDVFEGDSEVLIIVAMPGVTSDRVEVSHEPGALVVRGERRLPFTRQAFTVRQLEIPYGAFERRVALPTGRFEAAAPELTQGCLLVRLRRIA
jgi:HSP20 family protein